MILFISVMICYFIEFHLFNNINGKVEIFMALALPDYSVYNFLEERKNTLV